jgi:hypothetical protein
MLDEKSKGKEVTIAAPAPEGGGNVVNIMEALMSVYLYRWAVVSGLSQPSVVTVWKDSRALFRSTNTDHQRRSLKDALDNILTGFAADYYRANP